MLVMTGLLASSTDGRISPCILGWGGRPAVAASRTSGSSSRELQTLRWLPSAWWTDERCARLFLAKTALFRRAAGLESGRHRRRRIAVSAPTVHL